MDGADLRDMRDMGNAPDSDAAAEGPGALGRLVRGARERAGLSLDALARRCGCVKSLLSAIETGKRLPSPEMVAKLVEGLMLDRTEVESLAARARAIAAGGETFRRDLRRIEDRAQRPAAASEAIAHLANRVSAGVDLDAMLRSGALHRLAGMEQAASATARGASGQTIANTSSLSLVPLGREVPLINRVAAGYPREFTDLGYPARVADEYVRVPELADPDAFAARVVGDSMSPVYLEGDVVIFSPAKPVTSGMDCFARLERDAETTFKRVYFEQSDVASAPNSTAHSSASAGEPESGDLIRLQPLNSTYAPRVVPREEVAGLYAAVSVLRKIG
jgi:repressor LexA